MVQSGPIVNVQCALRRSDVYQPLAYSWPSVIRWALVVFGFIMLYGPGSGSLWGDAGAGEKAVWLAGFAVFVVFLLPWLSVQIMIRKYPAIWRSRSLSFSSEGMHLESEDARADYRWSVFYRINETSTLFLLMPTASTAVYVPKRCISSQEDIKVVRQLIRENFQGKKGLRSE